MKTYEKLSETSFKVSEVKELSSEIDALKQFEAIASQLSGIRKMIAQAKQLKETVKQTVEWYNTRADILNDAKSNCDLSYKELTKIELPDEFTLEDFDLSMIPEIDISKDN